MHIGQPEAPSLILVRQPFVIQSEQMQDRRLQIVDVDRSRRERRLIRTDRLAMLVGDVIAVVIGAPVGEAALDAAAGQPDREAARMVVAAVAVLGQFALRIARAAELAAPDDQGIVEQAAAFQVF